MWLREQRCPAALSLDGTGSQPTHKEGATAALRSGSRSSIPKASDGQDRQGPEKKEQALLPGLFQLHTKDRATTPSPLPPGLVVPFPPPSRRGGRGRTTAPGSLRARAPHPLPPSWLRSEFPFSLPPPTSVTDTDTAATRTPWPHLLTKASRPALRPRRLKPG